MKFTISAIRPTRTSYLSLPRSYSATSGNKGRIDLDTSWRSLAGTSETIDQNKQIPVPSCDYEFNIIAYEAPFGLQKILQTKSLEAAYSDDTGPPNDEDLTCEADEQRDATKYQYVFRDNQLNAMVDSSISFSEESFSFNSRNIPAVITHPGRIILPTTPRPIEVPSKLVELRDIDGNPFPLEESKIYFVSMIHTKYEEDPEFIVTDNYPNLTGTRHRVLFSLKAAPDLVDPSQYVIFLHKIYNYTNITIDYPDLTFFYGGMSYFNPFTKMARMNKTAVNHDGSYFWANSDIIDVGGADSIVTLRYDRGEAAQYMNPAPSTFLEHTRDAMYFPLLHFKDGRLYSICKLGFIYLSGEML
jgi:hypothetical protein